MTRLNEDSPQISFVNLCFLFFFSIIERLLTDWLCVCGDYERTSVKHGAVAARSQPVVRFKTVYNLLPLLFP